MNNKILVLVVLGIALFGGWMIFKDSGMEDTLNLAGGTSEMEMEGIRDFTVEGSNFSFSPKTISVKKGETVRITFTNTTGFHDLVIDEFDARTTQLRAGESETIVFVADKAGVFEYYCSVGTHRQQGMVGTLIITE